jgi:hypothetical protein
MAISDLLFQATGFGPSRELCEEFIDKVEAQAATVGRTLDKPARDVP